MPNEPLLVSSSRGVRLYIEVHMVESVPSATVSGFVDRALALGLTARYDPESFLGVELYMDWSDDQHLAAERLKRWIAPLPYVRLLIIEYAYDGRKESRSP